MLAFLCFYIGKVDDLLLWTFEREEKKSFYLQDRLKSDELCCFFITESIERPKYVLDENLSNFFEDKLIVSALMI